MHTGVLTGKGIPWGLIPAELVFPSATQNEISENDAKALINNGCIAVCEGANMPSTLETIQIFHKNKILFGPGRGKQPTQEESPSPDWKWFKTRRD